MTSSAVRQIADLPVFSEIEHADFGADFTWVTDDLYRRPYQGALRAPWGDDLVVYRNDDVAALKKHKEVAHQHLDVQTRPLMSDGFVPSSIIDFWARGTFAVRPPEHTPRKQLILKALTAQSVGRFRDEFSDVVRSRIDNLVDGGEIDFLSEFAKPVVSGFWSRAFGMPLDEAEYVMSLTERMAGITVLSPTPDEVRIAESAMREFTHVLPAALERTARSGGSPLVDDLVSLHAQMPDVVGRPENPFLSLTYPLLDGFNTLASMMASLIFSLDAAGVEPRLGRQDPAGFANNAFLEGTRIHTPVTTTFRQAANDFVYDDIFVPRDTNIVMLWLFANRDPGYFPDPLSFNLKRPNRVRQQTFGGGPFGCAGRNVAQAWTEALLTELVAAPIRVSVSGPTEWKPGSTLHELRSLPVTVQHD